MGGHPADVFHQLDRLFKDVVIDALDDEAGLQARLVTARQVGVVDVAVAVGARFLEVGAKVKLRRNGFDVVFETGRGHGYMRLGQ